MRLDPNQWTPTLQEISGLRLRAEHDGIVREDSSFIEVFVDQGSDSDGDTENIAIDSLIKMYEGVWGLQPDRIYSGSRLVWTQGHVDDEALEDLQQITTQALWELEAANNEIELLKSMVPKKKRRPRTRLSFGRWHDEPH